jgi:aspartate/methionine/tyrosine aminotransferase
MLADEPVQALHTEGGWSAILQLPCIDSEEVWITRLLQEQKVLVQPGYFFDMASEPYAVISLITPEDIFAEGIRRIGRLAGTN